MSNITERIILKTITECQCCSKKRIKTRKDKNGFYENKILGEGGEFRCKECQIIKPFSEFSLVNSKINSKYSTNRRKKCRSCRNTQMMEAYRKRQAKKALQSNDNN